MADRGAQVQQVVAYLDQHQWAGDHSQIIAALWDLSDTNFQQLSKQIQSGQVPVGQVTDVVEQKFTEQDQQPTSSTAKQTAAQTQSPTAPTQTNSTAPSDSTLYTSIPKQIQNKADAIPEAQWAELTAALGYDAKGAFTRYSNNFKTTRQSYEGKVTGADVDPFDWYKQHEQIVYGQWQPAVDELAAWATQESGQVLDFDTRQKLLTALTKATPAAQTEVLSYIEGVQSGTISATGISAGTRIPGQDLASQFPWLGNILKTAPSLTADAARAAAAGLVLSRTGKTLTDAQWSAMKSLSPDQQSIYVDNLQMGNGLTYGAYNYNMNRTQTDWYKYFGKTPTDKDIVFASTKSDQELKDWIFNQPSHLTGLTVGQHEGLQAGADKISQDLWGTNSNADMIKTLASAEKAK